MPAVTFPIEQAPRDGTRILAKDRHGWREMWWKVDAYEGEYWQDEFDSEPSPTCWIEMPITIEPWRSVETG